MINQLWTIYAYPVVASIAVSLFFFFWQRRNTLTDSSYYKKGDNFLIYKRCRYDSLGLKKIYKYEKIYTNKDGGFIFSSEKEYNDSPGEESRGKSF